MKITPVKTIYLVSTPFKMDSDKGELLERILDKKLIVTGIKKDDLNLIEVTTTRGDEVYTPKTIRLEVDSRYMSKEKLEKILSKAIDEVRVMFLKDNIELTKTILAKD